MTRSMLHFLKVLFIFEMVEILRLFHIAFYNAEYATNGVFNLCSKTSL